MEYHLFYWPVKWNTASGRKEPDESIVSFVTSPESPIPSHLIANRILNLRILNHGLGGPCSRSNQHEQQHDATPEIVRNQNALIQRVADPPLKAEQHYGRGDQNGRSHQCGARSPLERRVSR